MRTTSRRDLQEVSDPVLVATAGRSGTHLIIDTLRYQFAELGVVKMPGRPVSAVFVPLDEVAIGNYSDRAARRTLLRTRRAIGRSHDWPGVFDKLDQVDPEMSTLFRARAKVISVIRNPLVAFPKLWALAAQNFGWEAGRNGQEQFVEEKARSWAAHMTFAASSPRHMVIRLEDMLDTPAREIGRLGVFLDAVPRMRAPLLIPPHRNRFESGLARLAWRPRSTHAFLRQHVRANFPMAWTDERLAILDAHAGDAMQLAGYARPLERASDPEREAIAA